MDMFLSKTERVAIIRVCLDIAGADHDVCRREANILNEISNEIGFTDRDFEALEYIDFDKALDIISNLSEREKGFVRWAIMNIVEADGNATRNEMHLARLAGIFGDLD